MKRIMSRLVFGNNLATVDRIAKWLDEQGRYTLFKVEQVLDKELVQDIYRDMSTIEWYWRISPAGLTLQQKNEDIMLSQMFVLVVTVDEQK